MWDAIIGHGQVIAMLQSMVSKGRLPHALLFTGPSGIGKALVAKALAASLLCGAVQPCGHCNNCLALARQSHAGFFPVNPDGNSIKIDQIRAISHEASMGSGGQARICVIHDAEKMTVQSANSLLKLLEEPPANFYFLLLATSMHALLPTILSRCLTIKFLPLPAEELTAALTRCGYDSSLARTAARLSGGRMGQALELLQPQGFRWRDEALALAHKITAQEHNWFFAAMNTLDSWESSELIELLRYLLLVFRDITVWKTTGSSELLFNTDCDPQIVCLAEQWPAAILPAAVQRVRAAARALAANANAKLTWEALLIELAHMAKEGERTCKL